MGMGMGVGALGGRGRFYRLLVTAYILPSHPFIIIIPFIVLSCPEGSHVTGMILDGLEIDGN